MKKKLKQFSNLVKKRSKGEPIAYLLNKKDFWKYEFYVDKGILFQDQTRKLLLNKY